MVSWIKQGSKISASLDLCLILQHATLVVMTNNLQGDGAVNAVMAFSSSDHLVMRVWNSTDPLSGRPKMIGETPASSVRCSTALPTWMRLLHPWSNSGDSRKCSRSAAYSELSCCKDPANHEDWNPAASGLCPQPDMLRGHFQQQTRLSERQATAVHPPKCWSRAMPKWWSSASTDC